ncbi:MAG: acyl-ACP--UDP-N-acetylglucosamine O-acyltransferase [Alphaproteobacteria bacterium]
MSSIHPTAIVHDGAKLGADVEIGPFCIVGADVTLGDRVRLISHAIVDGETEIGADCTVHPHSRLGGPPQHLGHKGEKTRLVVGPRNLIRECVTFNTGTVAGRGVTTIGADGMFMVGSHVAHDCIIGDHVVLANNGAVGGHASIGDYVFLGGNAAVHQYTRIGRYAFIGGVSAVTKDVIPFGSVWGVHAHLEGLNLVGLKRRGFSRESIRDLRSAFRLLFADEGTFQERLDDVARVFKDVPEVMEVVTFIRADSDRPLCQPRDDD